jgi:hypothetical protein
VEVGRAAAWNYRFRILLDYHPFRYVGRVIMVQLMGWSLCVL